MDIGVISVRYARALLKASLDAGVEDKVYSDMQILAQNYITLPELRKAVDNPMLSKELKEQLLVAAVGNNPCDITRSFLSLVLKEARESILQFMANSYVTLYRKQKNIISAKLITAAGVTKSIEGRMRHLVESKTNGTVQFETSTDLELIGGFILEYDTYRMDASLKTKLNTILAQLSN